MIGALPPVAAIAYTRTAGEPEKSPAQELRMPPEPALRRERQANGRSRRTHGYTRKRLKHCTFQR